MQTTHIRLLVEQALGSPISDREMRYLDEELFLQAIDRRELGAIDRAVKALREGRETFGGTEPVPRTIAHDSSPSGSRHRRAKPLEIHEDALSDLLAIHASQNPSRIESPETRGLVQSLGVAAFRREVLGDRFVALERVGEWIRDQASRERPAGRPLLLAYGLPSAPHVYHEAVSPGGILDRLRKVSERLSDFYGWQDAQATVFVLTGVTPRLSAIVGEIRSKGPISARSRIVLTVDPKVTPAELARYYQSMRQHFGARMRRLSEKHARLAVFAAQQDEGESPDVQRQRWNEQCKAWKRPSWRYKDTSQFKRDYQKALERLAEL